MSDDPVMRERERCAGVCDLWARVQRQKQAQFEPGSPPAVELAKRASVAEGLAAEIRRGPFVREVRS